MKTSIAFILSAVFLTAIQFGEITAQTSPEIERLTAAIAKTPENDLLYIERGRLYTWNNKWVGPSVPYGETSNAIDENRLKAIADADMAIKKNPNSYKAYAFRAYLIGQIGSYVKRTGADKDLEKAATLRNNSNVVANIYKYDLSGQKTINPSSDPSIAVLNIIFKGAAIGSREGFASLSKAKDFSKKRKQPQVLMLNKVSGKYFLYEAHVTENIYPNVQLAETPFSKALIGKSNIPLTYEALKIEPEYSVQPMPADKVLDRDNLTWQFVDVLDAEGLSLIKSPTFQLLNGSKGVRLLFDSELSKGNFDEALKIYNWYDKRNTANNANDLDVVKITRKTNLSKLYQYAEKLRPFVEAEMIKWKYVEADKAAVRGVR